MAGTAVIFIEFGVLITLIVTVMSCVCCRKKQKNPGTENKPQNGLNNNQNLQGITNVESGDHGTEMCLLDLPQMRNRPRKLPELPPPPGEGDSNQDDYARVSDIPRTLQTSIASPPRSNSIEATLPSTSDNMNNAISYDSNNYATVNPSPSRQSQHVNEIPPPVPEKHFDQGESSSESSSNPSAASAVAGLADLPYVTTPSRVPDLNRPDPDSIYDGNLRTPCYTSISVREPLEKILAQASCRRVHEETEPQYSSDDLYEEIQPEPPSLVSLKIVAQAQHSRQASCSSVTASDAASLHSPTFERNLNPRGSQPTIEDPSSPYSVVNKPPKKQPPAEAVYAQVQKDRKSTGARSKQSSNGNELAHHAANFNGARKDNNDLKSSKGTLVRRHSSKDDPNYEKITDPPLRTTPSGHLQNSAHDHEIMRTTGASNSSDQRNGSDPGYETMPGNKRFGDYETISDAGYSCSYDEENVPGYEQVPMPYQRPYPAYESVEDYAVNNGMGITPPGENPYWQIPARGETNDPVYEKINRSDDDPNYDKVRKYEKINHSDYDPNYEKVKSGSEQSDEETSEPGYEKVKHTALPQNTYEKVRGGKELLNVDPGYEKIHDNRVELHVEWNGDALAPNDGSSSSFIAHLSLPHVPLAPNFSENLPDFVLPPAPSGEYAVSPYAPLSSVNEMSTYNVTFRNYDDQASSSAAIPNKHEDNKSMNSISFKGERHDSLL